jgi:hypothetical protein
MEKEFLLRSIHGEVDLMEKLSVCTSTNRYTKKKQWITSSIDYTINPFGKLTKTLAVKTTQGKVLEHKRNFHGFFANIKCTEEFYKINKTTLDFFIVTDEHKIDRTYQPTWI